MVKKAVDRRARQRLRLTLGGVAAAVGAIMAMLWYATPVSATLLPPPPTFTFTLVPPPPPTLTPPTIGPTTIGPTRIVPPITFPPLR
jgi:hypothetical protein